MNVLEDSPHEDLKKVKTVNSDEMLRSKRIKGFVSSKSTVSIKIQVGSREGSSDQTNMQKNNNNFSLGLTIGIEEESKIFKLSGTANTI